jgi:hypothetical protein
MSFVEIATGNGTTTDAPSVRVVASIFRSCPPDRI